MRGLKLWAGGALLAFMLANLPAMAADVAAPVAAVAAPAVVAAPPATPRAASVATVGQPRGGWELQEAVTPIGREARAMSTGILDPMMVSISIFVLALLAFVMWRFRAGRNPVASKTSHNTTIEIIWTLLPVLILAGIAVPSFRLLANQYDPPKADMTIKAIGHQWYWEYEYPDQGGFSFDAIASTKEEAAANKAPYLLDTDNRVVVPVGATVKVLVTAADVIHAWSVPSFWVQMDGVPGRLNETWFKAEKEGVYFGQCNQLCGTRHGFMPIAVQVVSKQAFTAWVAAKQKENGITPPAAATPAADAAPAVSPTAVTEPAAAPAATN